MSRLARNFSPSGVYHILFRGVNKQNIFEEHADYQKLKETIKNIKSEMGFDIYAYCFMDNHAHLVLKEKNSKDISLIMKRILTKYARWYNIKYQRSGALIANRYKSIPVETDEYFLHLIRYIHQNPVKAGIVNDISDYAYSSYNEYTDNPDLIDEKFVLSMIDLDEFKEFHNEIGIMEFNVSDGTKKTDNDLRNYIYMHFQMKNPMAISEFDKKEQIKIFNELKENFSARQIQRVTGISRSLSEKSHEEPKNTRSRSDVPIWF